MSNLGRLVKWQDADNGWRTGRVVTAPQTGLRAAQAVSYDVVTADYAIDRYVLIQESCDYQLSWVPDLRLTEWETREQRAVRGEE